MPFKSRALRPLRAAGKPDYVVMSTYEIPQGTLGTCTFFDRPFDAFRPLLILQDGSKKAKQ